MRREMYDLGWGHPGTLGIDSILRASTVKREDRILGKAPEQQGRVGVLGSIQEEVGFGRNQNEKERWDVEGSRMRGQVGSG